MVIKILDSYRKQMTSLYCCMEHLWQYTPTCFWLTHCEQMSSGNYDISFKISRYTTDECFHLPREMLAVVFQPQREHMGCVGANVFFTWPNLQASTHLVKLTFKLEHQRSLGCLCELELNQFQDVGVLTFSVVVWQFEAAKGFNFFSFLLKVA